MKALLFAPLAFALLAASPAAAPRRTGTCSPMDAFSLHFRDWVSHTVRDTSWYAQESRGVASLSYNPSATVTLIDDAGVCSALAIQFARTISGRDTVNVNDVIAVAVDSAYYVITDLGGGPSQFGLRNPDGSLKINHGRSDFVDAITIDRSQSVTTMWQWEQLPGRAVPY